MTPFEYLSVLISIILGLGISHLLTSAARLIQRRQRVRFYAPTLLWMATLFLAQVQIWWAAYDARHDAEWNFFSFLFFLLIPVLAYLLTYVLVPDLETEGAIDLRASYHANRVWFFALLGAVAVVSLTRDLARDGRAALDVAFRASFLVLAGIAASVKREGFHQANAVLVLLLFGAYVLTLFVQLS